MNTSQTHIFKSTSSLFPRVWIISLTLIGIAWYFMTFSVELIIVIGITIIPLLVLPFVFVTQHEIRNGNIYTRIPRLSMHSNGNPTPYMSVPIKNIIKVEMLHSRSHNPKGIRIWINNHKVDSRVFYVNEVQKMITVIKEQNPEVTVKTAR